MKEVQVDLLKGDITERITDAIVNTSNNRLILGSGLSGAIKAKGGGRIAEELQKYGSIEIGEAVYTSGGELKAGGVIHIALTEFDGPITEENIGLSLHACLSLANKNKLKSLSIPDLSVGITRFPPDRCAHTVFTVLKRFIEEENRSLRLVEIVVWDIESLRIYKEAYPAFFHQEME